MNRVVEHGKIMASLKSNYDALRREDPTNPLLKYVKATDKEDVVFDGLQYNEALGRFLGEKGMVIKMIINYSYALECEFIRVKEGRLAEEVTLGCPLADSVPAEIRVNHHKVE